MTDVLIRDVPEEVVAALDAHAARLGIDEYVRRSALPALKTPPRLALVGVADLALSHLR